MGKYGIQGTILDQDGNPVSGADVYLHLQNSPIVVNQTTTDANGEYIFQRHKDGTGSVQQWVVTAAYEDGSGSQFTALSQPKVSASLAPDSVVWQVSGDTYSTGDSTWEDYVGGSDVSIFGDPQSETLSDGSAGVRGDGTDDFGLWTPPPSLGGSSLNSCAWELAVQFDGSGVFETGNYNGSSGTSIRAVWNEDAKSNADSGNFRVNIVDDSGNQLTAGPQNNPNLNDGTLHRVTINIVDASNNDVEVIIDGSSVTVETGNTQSPSNFGTQNDRGIFARNNDGSIDRHGNIAYGIVRWHDSPVSVQTI